MSDDEIDRAERLLHSLRLNLRGPGRSLEAARALCDATVIVALVAALDETRERGSA